MDKDQILSEYILLNGQYDDTKKSIETNKTSFTPEENKKMNDYLLYLENRIEKKIFKLEKIETIHNE